MAFYIIYYSTYVFIRVYIHSMFYPVHIYHKNQIQHTQQTNPYHHNLSVYILGIHNNSGITNKVKMFDLYQIHFTSLDIVLPG
jgi:hypothetical protein